jgi:hypothetical protein
MSQSWTMESKDCRSFAALRMTAPGGCSHGWHAAQVSKGARPGAPGVLEEFEKEKTGWLPVFLKAES